MRQLLKRADHPDATVVPNSEFLAAQAPYTETLVPGSSLGPNYFQAFGVYGCGCGVWEGRFVDKLRIPLYAYVLQF